MIERGLQTQRADRWSKTPAEVGQPLDEMRRQPEVIRTELAVVFALAQSRVCEWLPISVDQLILLQLRVELESVKQN